MTANEKIYEGMKLIKEGCAMSGLNCDEYCPFAEYCIGYDSPPPNEWVIMTAERYKQLMTEEK